MARIDSLCVTGAGAWCPASPRDRKRRAKHLPRGAPLTHNRVREPETPLTRRTESPLAPTDAHLRQARTRRAQVAGVAALGARAAQIVVGVLTVRLTLSHLGATRYGAWVALTSVVGAAALCDLGLGFGLVDAINDAHARNDDDRARRSVSTTLCLLACVALAALVAWHAVAPYVRVASAFGLAPGPDADALRDAISVVTALAAAGVVTSAATHARSGLQEAHINALFEALGAAVNLGALALVVRCGGDFVALGVATFAGPVCAAMLNGALLLRARPALRPTLSDLDRRDLERTLGRALRYFVLTALAVVSFHSHRAILVRRVGPESVAEYDLALRLFTFAPTLTGLALAPLWAAYGEARARGDAHWIARTFRRSLAWGLAFNIPVAVGLALLHRPLIRAWVHDAVELPPALVWGWAFWAIASAAHAPLAVLYYGLRDMRFQAMCGVASAALSVTLAVALCGPLGAGGVIWGTTIAQVLFLTTPFALRASTLLARLDAPLSAHGGTS